MFSNPDHTFRYTLVFSLFIIASLNLLLGYWLYQNDCKHHSPYCMWWSASIVALLKSWSVNVVCQEAVLMWCSVSLCGRMAFVGGFTLLSLSLVGKSLGSSACLVVPSAKTALWSFFLTSTNTRIIFTHSGKFALRRACNYFSAPQNTSPKISSLSPLSEIVLSIRMGNISGLGYLASQLANNFGKWLC